MTGLDLTAEELIRLQIELEYRLTPAGDLVPFSGSSEQACFIIHHHAAGYMCFTRHDLPADVRNALAGLPSGQAFQDHGPVQEILKSGSEAAIFSGVSCCFIDPPGTGSWPGVSQLEDEAGRAVLAMEEGGEIVSACTSVRENGASAEAWVYTEPGYRRRGYALQVTRAWADHIMSQGKMAFYSYALDNEPSRRLARKLGLLRFSTVVAYD